MAWVYCAIEGKKLMQRYFLNETITDEINLASNQSIFKHFGKVLRARVGTQAEFVDNNRRVVIAEVVTITPESIHLKVINTISAEAELPLEISVVVSPLKNDRSDWFVQKATELGVHHIIFTNMARTVTDWHKQQDKKQLRFQKIAQAAAEQAHRLMVPTVQFIDWQAMIAQPKNLGLVAWEESARAGESANLVQTIREAPHGAKIVLLFGPEGGLTTSEVTELTTSHFISAGLGPRILRAETAPLYALSAISVLRELI